MRYLFLLVITSSPLVANCQNVFFNFTDGSTVSYPIADVRSTDFEGGNMRVFLWDSTSYSWSMSSLANYQFNDLATQVNDGATALTPLDVYPNPTSGEVTIGFDVQGEGEVLVEVKDLRGSLVRIVHQGTLPIGAQRLRWDGRDAQGQLVPNGNYLCCVVQGLRSATKQVIVQR